MRRKEIVMILDEIAACTRLRMEEQKQRVPFAEVKARAESLDANTGFPLRFIILHINL